MSLVNRREAKRHSLRGEFRVRGKGAHHLSPRSLALQLRFCALFFRAQDCGVLHKGQVPRAM